MELVQHGVYRDGVRAALERRDQLFADASHRLADCQPALRSLYARRVARAAAGAATTIALGLCAVWTLVGSIWGVTERLLGSALLALPVYWLARVWAGRRFDQRVTLRLRRTPDPFADIERLEAEGAPLSCARELCERLETRSIAYPMVAFALAGPLLLHFVVYAMFVRGVHQHGYRDFDTWILVSALFVGHAHVYLALRAAAFARDLRLDQRLYQPGTARVEAARCGNSAWAGTTGISALPGVVLLAIPPLLVAITGGFVIPLMFRLAGRTVLRERALLTRPGS